jgi:cysteine-rich repeat protein
MENSDALPDGCRMDCTVARCGDGVVDSGEQCDDGNTLDDRNGCSATCQNNSACGDGVVQLWYEQCEPPDTATCDSACVSL